MKLIIVRHGETIENAAKILMGHQHGRLSELGKKQAEKLTNRLKNYAVDCIYASDLNRCQDTISGFAKEKELPVLLDPDLREISRGVFENGPKAKLYEAIGQSGLHKAEFKPEQGESFYDLRRRVRRFTRKIATKHKDQTVLICTHGGWIGMFVSIFLKVPLKNEAFYFRFGNTSVNIFEIKEDKKHEVQLINCTKHLDEA